MSAIQQIALTLYGQPVTGINIPIGSSVLWTLTIEDPDTREPIDLTGSNVVMSCSKIDIRSNPVLPPLFSHQADIVAPDSNGICKVEWLSGDTVPSLSTPLSPGTYFIDVWLTDSDGNRLQMLGHGYVNLTAVATLPGAPITPLPSQQPLAQGPQGPAGVGTIEQAGVALPVRGTLNFVSAARITAVDNPGASRTDIDLAVGAGLPAYPGGSAQYFLTETSQTPAWSTLTQDMIAAAFTASLAANGFSLSQEVGASIVNPAFTASYNRTAVAATLGDVSPNGTIALTSSPYTSFGYNVAPLPATTYTKNGIGNTVVWTLTANEAGGPSKTSTVTATWKAKNYWGTATPGTFNAAFITALASNALATAFATGGIAFGSGGGTQKFYYAFPASEGTPSTFKDTSTGFGIDFDLVASNVSITNGNGVAINYNLWASRQFQSGSMTISVS